MSVYETGNLVLSLTLHIAQQSTWYRHHIYHCCCNSFQRLARTSTQGIPVHTPDSAPPVKSTTPGSRKSTSSYISSHFAFSFRVSKLSESCGGRHLPSPDTRASPVSHAPPDLRSPLHCPTPTMATHASPPLSAGVADEKMTAYAEHDLKNSSPTRHDG